MRRVKAFVVAVLLAVAMATAAHPACGSLTPDDWFWWWYYGCEEDSAGGGGGGAG